jgi:hypothetical protein
MPKRTDLQSILILGSGPIVIGQAAEFDYSGTQAVRALREEGYRVILVNSNPPTIMTDPRPSRRRPYGPSGARPVRCAHTNSQHPRGLSRRGKQWQQFDIWLRTDKIRCPLFSICLAALTHTYPVPSQ